MIELVVLVVESDELLDQVVEEGPGLGCISPEHIISIKSHVKERIVKKHTERRTVNSLVLCVFCNDLWNAIIKNKFVLGKLFSNIVICILHFSYLKKNVFGI